MLGRDMLPLGLPNVASSCCAAKARNFESFLQVALDLTPVSRPALCDLSLHGASCLRDLRIRY